MTGTRESVGHKVCIITHPFSSSSGEGILQRFIHVISPISIFLFVITGIRLHDKSDSKKFLYAQIQSKGQHNSYADNSAYIFSQIRIGLELLKKRRYFDIAILYVGGSTLLLPLIILKILNKRTIVVMAASETMRMRWKAKYSKNMVSIAQSIKLVEAIVLCICDSIVVYSPSLIMEWGLSRYAKKIVIGYEQYVNFDLFKSEYPPSKRENVIGFVGRLSEEKGIIEFLEAAKSIHRQIPDTTFFVCGDGPLKEFCIRYIKENGLNDSIKMTGWLTHKELPAYLNMIKILVLPSYTEGLPNIMIESMACGTIFVGNRVGSIPDIVIDGVNGFILENNTPNTIASNLVTILGRRDLDKISTAAILNVHLKFTFQKAVDSYRMILQSNLIKRPKEAQ